MSDKKENAFREVNFCVQEIRIKKPHRFMSNKKFMAYVRRTFPREWVSGWGDARCNTIMLLIPTFDMTR